jgi:hypothetical protein
MQVNLDVADLHPENLLKGELRAGAFDLVLSDIEVGHPPGFDEAPLLVADLIELVTPKLDLSANHLKIGKVRVVNATLSVAHHAEGKTNLQHLLNDWKPTKSIKQRSTRVKGKEKNFIKTDPAMGFFVVFRFYGPLEGYINKTWLLNDFERIE